MTITHEMGLALIYIGLIIISPFVAFFAWHISNFLLDTYVSDEVFIVTYKEEGKVVSEIKISSMKDGSIVEKIKTFKESQHG